MASHQDEEEAGPSGIAAEEMRRLLNLSTLDEEEDDPSTPEPPDVLGERDEPLLGHELLDDSDEDDLCHEALERFERQRAFQTQHLQQSGGALTLRRPT